MAKHVGVDPKTVKAHLAEMEKTGFIRFYQVYPNFGHVGIEGSAYLFQCRDEDRKAQAIKKIEPIEGLLEVHNFLGLPMCVDLSYNSASELSLKLQRLQELTGDASPIQFYKRSMPEARRPLSRLDWRILKSLRYRAIIP